MRNAAYEIIAGKGATSRGIALAITQILDAVDHTSHSSVLAVAAPTDPELGLDGVCLSLPRVLDAAGAGPVLPFTASDAEFEAIAASARAVQDSLDGIR